MSSQNEILSVRCFVEDPMSGLLLAVERPITPTGGNPGMLELPGGKVEPDEPLALAAVRETSEETGLDVCVVGEPTFLTDYVIPDGTHRGRHYRAYGVAARIIGGRLGSGCEQMPTTWVAVSEIATSPRFTKVSRAAGALLLSRQLATL